MLRLTTNLSKLNITAEILNNTNLQAVRWHRKPRWVPVAKSKLFRIPARPVIPEDEAEELKRLNNNYRNHLKSIRRYLVAKYTSKEGKQEDIDQEKLYEDDFVRCSKINDEWNAAVRVEREKYFENEMLRDIEVAQERLALQKQRKELRQQEAEEFVRELKEQSKSFITADNIDAAIEHAFANPVDYNYSIDLEGNIYRGRDTAPELQTTEKEAVKQ